MARRPDAAWRARSRPKPGEVIEIGSKRGRETLELRLGEYWLPRVGIVLLLTGVVFLAGYVHQQLPKAAKVALLYIGCIALGGAGMRLDKSYETLGRALLAGALAGVYFVTYALHYVDALHLIDNSYFAGVLLLACAAMIAAVSEWKRSQPMAGLAFFLGYYTAIVPLLPFAALENDSATPFSLVAAATLAVAVIVLAAWNGWTWLAYGGVLATYFTYWIWFEQNELEFRLQFAFLVFCWLLFTGALFAGERHARAVRDRNIFGTINNTAFFALMTLALAANFPPNSGRYWILPASFGAVLILLAAILKARQHPDRSSFETHGAQGFILLAIAIVAKWSGYQQAIALSALASIMHLVGWNLHLVAARAIAHIALAAALLGEGARFLPQLPALNHNPETWTASNGPFLALATTGAAGVVMAWIERAVRERGQSPPRTGAFLPSAAFFALIGALAAAFAAHRFTPAEYFPAVTSAVSIALLLIAIAGKKTEIGLAAQVPLWLGQLTLLGLWFERTPHAIPFWSEAGCIAYTFLLAAWTARKCSSLELRGDSSRWLRVMSEAYFSWGAVLLMLLVFERVDALWEFPALAVEATLILLGGIQLGLRVTAVAHLLLTVVALFAFLLGFGQSAGWLAGHPVSQSIGLFGGVALVLFGERILSSTAARDLVGPRKVMRYRYLAAFLGMILLALALRVQFRPAWVTAAWATAVVALFLAGLAAGSRPLRMASLALLLIALFRVLAYDTAEFHTVGRIVSYLTLGSLLLVLGYLYARFAPKIRTLF